MIVEFFGLPGSGKTVQTKALLLRYADCSRHLLPDRSILRHGGLRRIFTVEFLGFFFKASSLWLKKKHKVRYDFRVLYYFSLIYLAYMEHRDRSGDCLDILDHGLIQCVSSLTWDEPLPDSKCEPLLRHFKRYFAGKIQFVFICHPEDDVLIERIRNRENDIRLKQLPPQQAKQVLQAQRRLFAQMIRELQTDFSVIQIDSSASAAENTEQICRQLDKQG